MTEKNIFIENLKKQIHKLAEDLIAFCKTLKDRKASAVITCQLVKPSSAKAGCRADCRAKPKVEFFSKISVVENADEKECWPELIQDDNLSYDSVELC